MRRSVGRGGAECVFCQKLAETESAKLPSPCVCRCPLISREYKICIALVKHECPLLFAAVPIKPQPY
jgi:hypothetical protein